MSHIQKLLALRSPKSPFVITDIHTLDFERVSNDAELVTVFGYFEHISSDLTKVHRALVLLNDASLINPLYEVFKATSIALLNHDGVPETVADTDEAIYKTIAASNNPFLVEAEYERLLKCLRDVRIDGTKCEYFSKLEVSCGESFDAINKLRAWCGAKPMPNGTYRSRKSRDFDVNTGDFPGYIAHRIFKEVGAFDLKNLKALKRKDAFKLMRPVFNDEGECVSSDSEKFVANTVCVQQSKIRKLAHE